MPILLLGFHVNVPVTVWASPAVTGMFAIVHQSREELSLVFPVMANFTYVFPLGTVSLTLAVTVVPLAGRELIVYLPFATLVTRRFRPWSGALHTVSS